jgi:hypothetical protein
MQVLGLFFVEINRFILFYYFYIQKLLRNEAKDQIVYNMFDSSRTIFCMDFAFTAKTKTDNKTIISLNFVSYKQMNYDKN